MSLFACCSVKSNSKRQIALVPSMQDDYALNKSFNRHWLIFPRVVCQFYPVGGAFDHLRSCI